jgi:hypothetical protein
MSYPKFQFRQAGTILMQPPLKYSKLVWLISNVRTCKTVVSMSAVQRWPYTFAEIFKIYLFSGTSPGHYSQNAYVPHHRPPFHSWHDPVNEQKHVQRTAKFDFFVVLEKPLRSASAPEVRSWCELHRNKTWKSIQKLLQTQTQTILYPAQNLLQTELKNVPHIVLVPRAHNDCVLPLTVPCRKGDQFFCGLCGSCMGWIVKQLFTTFTVPVLRFTATSAMSMSMRAIFSN